MKQSDIFVLDKCEITVDKKNIFLSNEGFFLAFIIYFCFLNALYV